MSKGKMYQIVKGVPYTQKNVQAVVTTMTLATIPKLPEPYGPHNLNEINQVAYAVLHHGLYYLSPREVAFVGQMARAGYVSPKQRKWLLDLAGKHLPRSKEDAA